ncbi:MAG: DJ-1/PfpI family protein [Eubacterium sp.]|nr:DJ-1/PfpI family protein [Eubacterium sp.]
MVYVFLANGFEETEAIAPIDILRRAGAEVVTVGVGGGEITGSHGITVIPDIIEQDVLLTDKVDMIVLPGGMPGTLNLEKSPTVQAAIKFCADNGKLIGAICAAPSVIGKLGLLDGKEAVCFPGFEDFLTGAKLSENKVCIDGDIITAAGAGVAVQFGLALVKKLIGEAKAEKISASMQCI